MTQVRSMKRARDIRDQLEGLLERLEIKLTTNPKDLEPLKKAITSAFFHHSARLQKSGSNRTVKNPQTVHIHPSSGMAQMGDLPGIGHDDQRIYETGDIIETRMVGGDCTTLLSANGC